MNLSRNDKLTHYAAGMLRWLLTANPMPNWKSDFFAHCDKMAQESQQLEDLPTETEQKTQAMVKAVPGVALFWLGVYTSGFWLLPSFAIGLFSSYFIAGCVNQIFSSGKEARFFRTLIHYLLRMENADGVISDAELASLRAIIEFLPTSLEEKQALIKATEKPDAYKELAPEGTLSDDEKEKILSACWSLALCDGIADSERRMYSEISKELQVSTEKKEEIRAKVEKLFDDHAQLLWLTVKVARTLNQEISDNVQSLFKVASLVSLKPLHLQHFAEEIARSEIVLEILPQQSQVENERLLLAAFILARSFGTSETDNDIAVREAFKKVCGEDFEVKSLEPFLSEISSVIKSL